MSPPPRIGLRQLLAALSLAGMVPLAIMATVLLVALWRAQEAGLRDATRAAAQALAAAVEQRAGSPDPQELRALLRLPEPSGLAWIADADGRILAHAGANGHLPESDAREAYSASVPVHGTRWTLFVSMPGAHAALRRSVGAFAALLAIVLAASGLFAWLIGRRLGAAVDAHAQAALELSARHHAIAEEQRRRDGLEREAALQAERRLREQAEVANRAKDEFLAMLGHELRNPLGAIGNAMRVIERLPATSADHKAAREIVVRQTTHLAKIVDDLLDVGRVVSGRILLRRNLVDLAQAAAAAVATVRAGEQEQAHEWTLELTPVLVSADATRIDQVLANLLGNAAKFTPRGGRIRVRLAEEAGDAVLSVEDSGPGIDRELLPHVFDLFAKANQEQGGLGIGLALVKRLVELHGGRVTAENLPHGARFTVRLPAIPEPEPVVAADARPLPAPRPARQARVLIVEDNDDARVTLQRILQADGHLVSAARDARAGLEAAVAGSPNIAVVDIGLPGMDGYQFARELRERLGSGVRLIALTGYGTRADRRRSAEAGFDAHLTKPVDLDRLLALITEAAN